MIEIATAGGLIIRAVLVVMPDPLHDTLGHFTSDRIVLNPPDSR
jgi:hypothetical protein